MSAERKLTIDELIAALELHLSPRTDPDHCDPCPYDPKDKSKLDSPQDTCQYRLMRDCLDMLKRVVKQEEELFWVKDFIEYTLSCDAKEAYNDVCAPFAFKLGAAFENYKRIWEK